MVIVGLTGSIGMGKSTAAAMFRYLGIPVYDSDATVHRLLGPGGAAVPGIERAFPGVVRDGAVDRAALGGKVFGDTHALRKLERIVHPLVWRTQDRFLKQAASRRARLAVLDVPLLYETNGDSRCDVTVVVSAPAFLQRQRVLARPGMTPERFRDVLAKQMSDAEKRRRADFVIPSGLGRRLTLKRLQEIVTLSMQRTGTKWPPPSYPKRTHR